MLSLKFLAIMLGALCIATRLPGVLYPKAFSKVVKKFLKDEQTMRLVGLFPFMFGVAILMEAPLFMPDWTMVMSVIGWLFLVVALYMMWEPKMLEKRALKLIKKPGAIQVGCTIAVVIGVGLMYLGLAVY